MKQPLKPQPQQSTAKNSRRCTFRSNRISWCKKLSRICAAPTEYGLCSSYQPKQTKTEQKLPLNAPRINEDEEAYSPHALLIGTKTGQCDICKDTKKTLLLRYGFCLCEDCLNVCTSILDQLQFADTKRPKEKVLISGEKTPSAKTSTKKVLP